MLKGPLQAGQSIISVSFIGPLWNLNVVTAPAGTSIYGGTFVIPPALGDKTIHPYSDFLLHDIGTGDWIVQNGGPQSRNQLRHGDLLGHQSTRCFFRAASDAGRRRLGQRVTVATLARERKERARNARPATARRRGA